MCARTPECRHAGELVYVSCVLCGVVELVLTEPQNVIYKALFP